MVRGSPATSTLAWSVLLWSPLSLGGVDGTTEGRVEVFAVVGDGFVDVATGDSFTGFEEGMDGGVVGTDGEMEADVSAPDSEGEEGCCGIVVCATVVVTNVLVDVVEGLVVVAVVVVVVGVDVLLGVVVAAGGDVLVGVVVFVGITPPVIFLDSVACFDGVVCGLIETVVVDLSREAGGFIGLETLEMLAVGLNCCPPFGEEPS